MLTRLFSETVFTRSQKARASNFKSSFAAQRGKGLHLGLASQRVQRVSPHVELERRRKDSAFKFNAEVALP